MAESKVSSPAAQAFRRHVDDSLGLPFNALDRGAWLDKLAQAFDEFTRPVIEATEAENARRAEAFAEERRRARDAADALVDLAQAKSDGERRAEEFRVYLVECNTRETDRRRAVEAERDRLKTTVDALTEHYEARLAKQAEEIGRLYADPSRDPAIAEPDGFDCPEGHGPDCRACSGEACNKCGAGCWNNAARNCEHDVLERHEEPMAAPEEDCVDDVTSALCSECDPSFTAGRQPCEVADFDETPPCWTPRDSSGETDGLCPACVANQELYAARVRLIGRRARMRRALIKACRTYYESVAEPTAYALALEKARQAEAQQGGEGS